jgi:hypothetical protein
MSDKTAQECQRQTKNASTAIARETVFFFEGKVSELDWELKNISQTAALFYRFINDRIGPEGARGLAAFKDEIGSLLPVIGMFVDYTKNSAKNTNELWDALNEHFSL